MIVVDRLAGERLRRPFWRILQSPRQPIPILDHLMLFLAQLLPFQLGEACKRRLDGLDQNLTHRFDVATCAAGVKTPLLPWRQLGEESSLLTQAENTKARTTLRLAGCVSSSCIAIRSEEVFERAQACKEIALSFGMIRADHSEFRTQTPGITPHGIQSRRSRAPGNP